jgi:hypothetical protein
MKISVEAEFIPPFELAKQSFELQKIKINIFKSGRKFTFFCIFIRIKLKPMKIFILNLLFVFISYI